MQKLYSRLSLNHKMAVICGGLCLLVSLSLVGVSSFSSRYILLQQEAEYGDMVAAEASQEISKILDRGDLIGMEVRLEKLVSLNQLQGIRVFDIEQRQIGAAGTDSGPLYAADILLDKRIAGRLHVYLHQNVALAEQRSSSFSLLMLAVLLSLFGGALCNRLILGDASSLRMLATKLQLDDGDIPAGNEIDLIAQAVDALPLELLQPPDRQISDIADYQTAGLLYIRFNSLASYVETLDESALLRYTHFQHKLITEAAELYGGEVSVARQFGALISFTGDHKSGAAVLRAVCTAWVIRALAQSLEAHTQRKHKLSLCCGTNEAGSDRSGDFYSALYSQHIIDEMEQQVLQFPDEITVCEVAAQDQALANTTFLEQDPSGRAYLTGFPAPTDNLVERQHQLLLARLKQTA
jgi:hypothetical protein